MNKAYSGALYFSNVKSTSEIHSFLIKGYQSSCCNLLLSNEGHRELVILSPSSIRHDIAVTKHHVLPGARSLGSNYYIRFVTSVVRRFIFFIPRRQTRWFKLFSIICKTWPDSVTGDFLQVYLRYRHSFFFPRKPFTERRMG